jgi:hypothetical protein
MTLRRFLERAAFPLALAVALGLALLLRPPAPRDVIALARIEPLPRPSGGSAAAFAEAAAAYEAGRWSESAAQLRAAIAEEPPDWPHRDEANLYLGSSLLLDSRPGSAAEPLRLAAGSTNPSISVRAKWCLAQAHLLTGDIDAARALLDELSQTPAYARPAAELLLRLRGSERPPPGAVP